MYRTATFSAGRNEQASNTVIDAEKALVKEEVAEKPLEIIAVDVTSYNPEIAQNDSTPCIGASGKDQCILAKEGKRIIALSQDLRAKFLEGKDPYFKYPVQVYLESNNKSIQGCYWVYDTMNKRWTNRVDLFFMDRKDNQGTNQKAGEKAHLSNKTEMCNAKTS